MVVRTGDASELGQIAEATQAVGTVKTPVQAKMEQLAKLIGIAIAVLAVVVVAGGPLLGMPLDEIIRTAVALTVGAVPEALPIVLTVTLAVGVQRMAHRNAIMRSLPAVETLGSTTVVASDKTGTLTLNRMTVGMIWSAGDRHRPKTPPAAEEADGEKSEDGADGDQETLSERFAEVADAVAEGRTDPLAMTLLAGLLANEVEALPDDGEGDDDGVGGDPTETALLEAAANGGLEIAAIGEQHQQVDIIPFESERPFMATINETPEGRRVFVKGSPEAVLERCGYELDSEGETRDLDADAVREAAAELADEGYRVLAMAYGGTDAESFDGDDSGDELVFAGL